MKLEHLGKIIEIDTKQATVESRIVLMLNKHRSGVRQNKLFFLTNSGRSGLGWQIFDKAVDRLVEENILARSATNHEHSFVLKLTAWGCEQAEDLEEMLSGRKAVVA